MTSLIRSAHLAGFVLAALIIGCDTPKLPSGPPQAAAPAPAPPPVETATVNNSPGTDLPQIAEPVTDDPRPVTPDDPIKGRRSKRAGGYLGATAHARFWAEHKIVFDQVKYNLGLYMAMEGDFPKSNEEFFEKIIKGYQMKLPELEPEHEYCYVPEEPEAGLQIRLK
ncbi:MAG: hypothetical protein IT424_07020, partial [Pirellulales bacterium]|nr:hypothetical protein [Pirellulales bacterium]